MIYVDALFPTTPAARWPYRQACHLTADNEQELHAFAAKLGLRRAWFQPQSHPHYDLTANKRRQAVALGAKAISHVELALVARAREGRV
jgi:Protein of unknown function (DUF4031)